MLRRFILFSLCLCAPLCVAPQILVAQSVEQYEEEEQDEADLASPSVPQDLSVPPEIHAVPAIITTRPMGNSPLSAAEFAPTVIAAPTHEHAVEQNSLAAPVLTTYGVLDERSGSLPMDVWKALTYPEATEVLIKASQRVAAGDTNGFLNEVLRVAALSRTYEPNGSPESAGAYFKARVFAAQVTGERDGALALLRSQPSMFTIQDWQSFIDNEVRQRRFVQVCAISADKLAQDLSPFAQKMSILCDIKNGKADVARLHLDLLREANDGDTLFLDLAERALNPNVAPKGKQAKKVDAKLEHLSTLQLAALTLGKVKLKPEQVDRVMDTPQPLILDVMMGDAQRLKFAERFARSHQITAQDYQTILASITFPPKAIAQFRAHPESLLTVPEKEWPAPLRRAAAFRAIAEEEHHAQKANLVAAAMAGLSNADLLGPLGDNLLAGVAGLEALPDNQAAASAMARLLLLRGNSEAANWWRLASASPAGREALLPVFPLALLRGVVKGEDRTAWFEQYGRTQALSAEKKNFNLAMVKILGVILPSNEDSQLAAQNVFPVMRPTDRRMDGVMDNLVSGTSEAVLRALLALKAMHQNALAEKLALLNV